MKGDRAREKQVAGFIDLCLEELERPYWPAQPKGKSTKEISRLTGLCTSTIYRLRKGKYGTKTQMGTVLKLSEATGMKLKLEEG